MADVATTKSTTPSSSMGDTERMPWPKKAPGPLDYKPERAPGLASAGSATAIRRGDAPCYSMRQRPQTAKTSKAKTLYSSTSAVALSSFGEQVPSHSAAAPAFTFGKDRERRRPVTPGPSDYRYHRSTLRSAGAGSFGGSRDDRFGGPDDKGEAPGFRPKSASAHVTPGPGEHWPPGNNFIKNGCHVMNETSTLQARPVYTFGGKHNKTQFLHEARPQHLGLDSPGPNKYPPKPLEEGASYTIQVKARGSVVNPPPRGDGVLRELTVLWRKPANQPGPSSYKPKTLFWDGRSALGRSESAPRSLLDPRTSVARPPRASWR